MGFLQYFVNCVYFYYLDKRQLILVHVGPFYSAFFSNFPFFQNHFSAADLKFSLVLPSLNLFSGKQCNKHIANSVIVVVA